MSDELTITSGVGALGVVASLPPPTKGPPDALYMPRRGSFELHGLTGKGFYVWKDGSFNNDDLSFISVLALPVGGGMIGWLYQSRGANFYIFFGDEVIGTTVDFRLDVYGMFWSVDKTTFFPWPTSYGALRFTVALPPSAGVVHTATGENVAQGVGSGSSFERHGLVWKLSLSETDVQELDKSAAYATQLIPEPDVVVAIEFAIGLITTVDDLGGNKGVDISGVLPTTTIFVTPRGSFDIIHVIEIVGGVARKVADQTEAAVKDGIKKVTDGFQKASDEAGKVFKDAGDFFSHL